MEEIKRDICIIGAGSGGLSITAFTAQMGISTVLIEQAKMGGDCLNQGCIPSKSLLSSSRIVHNIKKSESFGIKISDFSVDFEKVMEHVKNIIATIAPNDSKERFEKLGATVIQGVAKFVDKKTVSVNDKIIHAKYFVIATGAIPFIPSIPGLQNVLFMTYTNVFDLKEIPKHLLIIGGGPIGCEMAQAFLLFGVKVSLVQRSRILPHDEPESAEAVKKQLIKDGLSLYEQTDIKSISQNGQEIKLEFLHDGENKQLTGSHVLIATGRRPNIANLNLDAANIKQNEKGIEIDKKLRSVSNKRVFVIGDAAGSYQFTHIANYHAEIAIKNVLFHIPSKVDYKTISWVTYTEPELAHIGLTEKEAKEKFKYVKVIILPFSENDRAQTERETEGLIKVISTKKGKVLGVSIAGRNAGELINIWNLSIKQNLKLSHIANLTIPYPTRSEINKHVAGSFYKTFLFSSKTKKLIKFLMKYL